MLHRPKGMVASGTTSTSEVRYVSRHVCWLCVCSCTVV